MAQPHDAIEAASEWFTSILCNLNPLPLLESLALGNEPGLGIFPIAKRPPVGSRSSEHYGFSLRPEAVVEELSVGERQRLKSSKRLNRSVECLILDEPTAVLTPQETQDLFRSFVNCG